MYDNKPVGLLTPLRLFLIPIPLEVFICIFNLPPILPELKPIPTS